MRSCSRRKEENKERPWRESKNKLKLKLTSFSRGKTIISWLYVRLESKSQTGVIVVDIRTEQTDFKNTQYFPVLLEIYLFNFLLS